MKWQVKHHFLKKRHTELWLMPLALLMSFMHNKIWPRVLRESVSFWNLRLRTSKAVLMRHKQMHSRKERRQ